MEKIYSKYLSVYYKDEHCALICNDILFALKKIKAQSVDMIFADPPYFLSNNGITCHSGKMVSVNKGNWDKIQDFNEKHKFNRKWIRACKRILRPNGTIWISGTLHNIYSIGVALEQEGFKIINNITWEKTNPPPNLACKCFTHSTETVLWAKLAKGRQYFDYLLMKEENGGKQMKDVWVGGLTKKSEKKYGKHPTQKPLYLLEKIVKASTKCGDIVLDPFCGSSTTGVACKKLKRYYIGIDSSKEYIDLSKERIINTSAEQDF